ncbi:MAG: UbiH/UbiF family hydroxylase [Pseudomonadota bacterium]
MQEKQADIAVIGAGLAGLATTLALKVQGFDVVNIAPPLPKVDQRTTALWSDSVEFLNSLGIDEIFHKKGNPLRTIRMIDDTNRLIRSPQTEFHSNEIGLDEFGYNIANKHLSEELRQRIASSRSDVFLEAAVEDVALNPDRADLTLSSGEQVAANFVIGADGRNSAVRRASGITARDWSYPQTAIVLNFKHELPHDDVSTEFHTASGPFTIVPLGPGLCSLVWVETPEKAAAIKAYGIGELAGEIEKHMHSMLGKITVTSEIQSFPLSGMIANSFGSGRTVLVGEAAHVFPPIGAQGFNLGLRDVQAVTDLLISCVPFTAIASEYDRNRRLDVSTRTASIDLMNRSLLSSFLPVQLLRGIGMGALSSIGPLRRMAMREGIAPGKTLRMISRNLADRLPHRRYAKM